MYIKGLFLIFLLSMASNCFAEQPDIVFLGDKARIDFLKECNPSCKAKKFVIGTPAIDSTASEIANFSQKATHAVIVVDAAQGPLPVTREHVLIARQAGVPSLSILFVNVSSLNGMSDANELLELEVREVMNMYEMGGDKADVYHDQSLKSTENLYSNAIGFSSILSRLSDTPERKTYNIKYYSGNSISTFIYLLTEQEAKHTAALSKDGGVEIWVNGQTIKGKVLSEHALKPGDNGEIIFQVNTPVAAAEGSRFLLQNNGQIVGAGVVVRVSSR